MSGSKSRSTMSTSVGQGYFIIHEMPIKLNMLVIYMASNSKDVDTSNTENDCVSTEEEEVRSELVRLVYLYHALVVFQKSSLLEVLKAPKLSEITKMFVATLITRLGTLG